MRKLPAAVSLIAALSCGRAPPGPVESATTQSPPYRSPIVRSADDLADVVIAGRRNYVIIGEVHPHRGIKRFTADLVTRLAARNARVGLYLEALDTSCAIAGPEGCVGTGSVIDWNPEAYLELIRNVEPVTRAYPIDTPEETHSNQPGWREREERREEHMYRMVLAQCPDCDVKVVLTGDGHVNYARGHQLMDPAMPVWNVASRFPEPETLTVTLRERSMTGTEYIVRDLASIRDMVDDGIAEIFQRDRIADVLVFAAPEGRPFMFASRRPAYRLWEWELAWPLHDTFRP